MKCLQPQGNVWMYGIFGHVNTATLVIYQTELNLAYMSGFKGRLKTDISQWSAPKYATMLQVGCKTLQ